VWIPALHLAKLPQLGAPRLLRPFGWSRSVPWLAETGLGKIAAAATGAAPKEATSMVVLGLILLLIGLLAGIHILFVIGLVLLIVGLVMNFVPIGGTRRRYY
jgi:hypothetical protein